MADRCLQRPDCTSVTVRRLKDVWCVLVYSRYTLPPTIPPKTPAHSIAAVMVNAHLFRGENTGLPCWPLPFSSPAGSCVGPLYPPSHRFLPASVWIGPLTAPLSQQQDS